MDDTEKRQRPIRIPYASGPEGDFFASKLRAPPTRPGAVYRSSVIDRLTRDNSRPVVSVVAPALDAVEPIDGRVFDALASPVSSVPGSVVPRLEAAFWSMTTPVVLVLDDVHLLRDRECRDALSVLAEHVAAGSRMVLASREQPPLRLARLRAEGRVTEISVADLSLPREQAAALLRAAGVTLAADELAVLHQRTEGWPAGLYLAALSLREGGSLENRSEE